MFIFLFWSDGTIFSNLNMNIFKKFKLKKIININFFIAACIINPNFEEL